jgi:3-hydroxypropanoate dehydrogenase
MRHRRIASHWKSSFSEKQNGGPRRRFPGKNRKSTPKGEACHAYARKIARIRYLPEQGGIRSDGGLLLWILEYPYPEQNLGKTGNLPLSSMLYLDKGKERNMSAVNDAVLDTVFRQARTFNRFLEKPVDDALIRQLYDLLKWGPTAVNGQPGRYLFIRSPEAKARLLPAAAPGNQEKIKAAPVTVIVASDPRFHERLPTLIPPLASMRELFADNEPLALETALYSSALQAGYLIVAARLLGLDAGPMSGFDAGAVNAAFFPENGWRANLLVNLGYGDPSGNYPRNPRLEFDEAARIL